MGAQRKRYLQLAEKASSTEDKLFYKTMAELAPIVSEMARRNVNTIGGAALYATVLRMASALVMETATNLSGDMFDLEKLRADMSMMLELSHKSMKALAPVPCTPKMDS